MSSCNDPGLSASFLLRQDSIGKDLESSEAQHREVHRLMSFSTRLADLAGSKPSELQQLQALEADQTLGSIPEAAGVLDCLACLSFQKESDGLSALCLRTSSNACAMNQLHKANIQQVLLTSLHVVVGVASRNQGWIKLPHPLVSCVSLLANCSIFLVQSMRENSLLKAEVCDAADNEVSSALTVPQPIAMAETEPEPSGDSADAQLAALERELDLELQSAGNSMASLHQSTAIPGSTAGSQTAAAHEIVATSSSETSLQASAAGTEPGASSVVAANQARVWPLSATLARHRWRALLGRRTKDLPPETAELAQAPIADGPAGIISTPVSGTVAEEPAASPAAPVALQADAGLRLHIISSEAATASAPDDIPAHMKNQVGGVNEPPRAAMTAEAIALSSAQADGPSTAIPESKPTAAAEQAATAVEQQAAKRKFSFRNSLKEAAAVPAVLRQVSLSGCRRIGIGNGRLLDSFAQHCLPVAILQALWAMNRSSWL